MSNARTIGNYEIQAPLGKGAHGTAFRAMHQELNRAVCIKVLPPEALEQRAVDPFRKYAQGLSRVRHPGIASFIELIEEDGRLCLVSQLAEGAPLASLLKEGAQPDPKKAWEILKHLLETLAHAHQQGAAHRNLKPANIFVTPDDRVVLTDLGTGMLHRVQADAPEYCSPEQLRGERLTPKSDIYQAGVIAYRLVTGKLPFTGTPEEIAHRVAEERPTDPSSYNNKLAWQLDWVIQKALSKDPADRFNAAMDFAEGLRLGLQDTIGRPLPPLQPTAPAVVAVTPAATPEPVGPAPKAAPSPVVQNAKKLAPAAAPAAPAAVPAAAAAPPDNRPGVLFIDDDARILTSLRALFRQEYRVETAESGQAALDIIAAGGIQVVVSDQRMPGMTGVELLRKVRSVAPNAVRLLLTGYTDLASLVGSINQGEIFKFVMKPWDNDELKKAIAEAFAEAAKNAEAAPAKPVAPRSAGSLLVIDRAEGVAKGLERLLAGEAHVVRVETPAEAAKVLSREEIAAVVADMGSGMDGLVALFRELRAKRPGVLSILLTDEPDSELAIELINRAQIFRLLPKPVSARDLRTQVAEALRRYSVFKQRAAASKVGGDRPEAVPDRTLAGAA